MENRKGVILQSHIDMVPQKNRDKIHDFENDPIETRIEDGWVTANGTTLGADNGIGVAAIMAVLQDNTLKHGPIEALITIVITSYSIHYTKLYDLSCGWYYLLQKD